MLGLTDAQTAILRQKMPDISVVAVPAGAGPGVGAYSTWAFGVAVVARPGLDAAVAYHVTKAINENVERQAAAFGSLKGADIGRMTMLLASIPLHPGAALLRGGGLRRPRRGAAEVTDLRARAQLSCRTTLENSTFCSLSALY